MSTTIVEDVKKESYETKTFNSSEEPGSSCSKLWGVKPICRLCLSRRGPTHCLLSESTLLHKLRICLPLKISETDKLPKEVCEMCFLKIIDIYEYYHKAKLAEKKLLLHFDNFSNTIAVDTPLETDKILIKEDLMGNFDDSQLEINIKDEPLESAYEDLTTLYRDTRNENSKYTQTDDVVITFENILDGHNSPRNNVKIEIKEEILSESPWNSPSHDDILDSLDENDYSSEDNIALNKVLKIPPIKVRIKKEYSEIEKNKKTKKRKKELSVKKLKISSKESLIKKKRMGYLEHDIKLNTEKSEESMKVEKPDHYKDHVEYPDRFVQNLDQGKKEKVEVDVEKDDDIEKREKGKKKNYKLISPADNEGECTMCNKKFSGKNALNKHFVIHAGEKSFKCTVCNKKFSGKNALNRHIAIHTGEKNFECTVCDKKFSRKEYLDSHFVIHTGEKKFECTVCNKNFSGKNALNRHFVIHTGEKNFECTVCNKKFSHKGNLESHFVIHTGEKNFECTVCYKRFSHKVILDRHFVIHTGEKNFECTVCNKKFTHKGSLDSHFVIHTGEKNFECTVCNKKFSHKAVLDRHLVIHTGEKNFECTVCNKKFSHKGSLDSHFVRHTGEKKFECPICNKKFSAKSAVNRHIVIHTSEKNLECTVCDKKFSRKEYLDSHFAIHTGGQNSNVMYAVNRT